MKWITRKNVKVDRVACPWLIRKFIDPQAEFIFVSPEAVMDTAVREGAIPFDIAGAELEHHEGKCSFEAIVAKYGIKDPAIRLLAASKRPNARLELQVASKRDSHSNSTLGSEPVQWRSNLTDNRWEFAGQG